MASILKQRNLGPITVQRFYQSLEAAWMGNPRLTRPRPLARRIGIAVSGGADSMLLAEMCRQLQQSKPELDLFIEAFIVDHKARKESSEEALKVGGWLKDIGIKHQILPLDWSSGQGAADVTAFETTARQKRYLALGQACHQNKIEALLTGHHSDDNVETAIMRLCQHSGRLGLNGISPLSRIPECQHVWGISGSGRFEEIQGYPSQEKRSKRNKNKKTTVPEKLIKFDMAAGGPLLCRPLLPYTKSNILETCEQLQVPYVTDPTNFDPTLTTRNTIRSLLATNQLPRALQPPSIQAFISSNRASLNAVVAQTDSVLPQCKLLDFYPFSSTLTVQFPVFDQSHPLMTPETDPRLLPLTLRRISELISPLEYRYLPLQKYAEFATAVFSGQQKNDFSVGGAHYRLLPIEERGIRNTWHVSRVPFHAHRAPETIVSGLRSDRFTTPILWDSRFWLQFRLKTDNTTDIFRSDSALRIRALTQEDMAPVTRALEKYGYSKKLFATMAPSKSRFTLPIVTANLTSFEGKNVSEEYFALPTLGIDLSTGKDLKVECRWAYRTLDVNVLDLLGWLKPGNGGSTSSEGIY